MEGKRNCFGEPLQLCTCPTCGTVFQPVVPTAAELANWYSYMGQVPRLSTLTPLLQRRLGRTLDELQPFAAQRPRGRLLEVGCGGGLLVRVAQQRGWEVHATDVSESCCQLLRPLLADRLHQGDVQGAPFAENSFDAVVMMEVVEHLIEPLDDLQRVYALLRPGGALYVTTPNLDGFTAGVRGGKWRAVVDEHLNYFTARTLETLLRKVGFSSFTHRTSYIDVASLLGRSSQPDSAAPAASGPASLASTLRANLKAAVMDPAITAMNLLVGASGKGDTLRTIAIKPG